MQFGLVVLFEENIYIIVNLQYTCEYYVLTLWKDGTDNARKMCLSINSLEFRSK